jgi:hypothetical protein
VTRTAVEQFIYLLDEAFEGSPEHSLVGNVCDLEAEDWTWRPPDGKRSILAIFGHAGSTKYLYDSHAFGDGSIGWLDPILNPLPAGADFSPDLIIDWARRGHVRFRDSVARLNDEDLSNVRHAAIWDQPGEARWFIAQVIEHDLYHAGEINHLRALRQKNDDWPR